MVQAGLSPSLIIVTIEKAPKTAFEVSATALADLKTAGVPELVLRAMLDAQTLPPSPPPTPSASTPSELATRSPSPVPEQALWCFWIKA